MLEAKLEDPNEQCLFSVRFRRADGEAHEPYHYEAETPQEAQEIVAKLNHIANLHHGGADARMTDGDVLAPHSSHGASGSSSTERHNLRLALNRRVSSGI